MTEFWLIRHGQTDWNILFRYQGQTDIPLNETGLAQARALAAQLAESGQPFAAIYSSDLVRAARTAEILGGALHLEVCQHTGLRELCFGEWEGHTRDEIHAQYAELVAERRTHPLDARPPGGETNRELAQRITNTANEIARAHPTGPVIIVSHGLALAMLTCLACDYPLEDVYSHGLDNAAPRQVTWNYPGSSKFGTGTTGPRAAP
jgi:2,3-bisphosphoglycerate-dependent phosphoglycerate mutase